jgi:hypothetical protein
LIEKTPKKREKKALPIIYLHDFLIEKTQKKERKKGLPIIYLPDFLIEKTDCFFLKK